MAVQLLNETNVMALPIDDIKPNPYQQRKYFDFYSLNRLTESIKKYGVIQPVTVRLVNGKTYELVAGERRLRAARAAGLKTIPAVFIDADEEESSVISFIENLQRKTLSYMEEAEGYKALTDDCLLYTSLIPTSAPAKTVSRFPITKSAVSKYFFISAKLWEKSYCPVELS